MNAWMEPGERVREAVLSSEVFANPFNSRRVIVATDSHVYVMKRGFRERDLITEMLAKLDINEVQIARGVAFFGGGILQGARINSKSYTPTNLGGIRDLRRLYWFVIDKRQPGN